MMGKTLIFLLFPSLNQVRNMHNYLRFFLNPMHNGKITFIYFKWIKKNANKNHTSYSNVPKLNPHGEDEDWNRRSLVNSKSPAWWLEPWFWNTFDGEEKRVEAMALYLFRWWKTKAMETLTPMGYCRPPFWEPFLQLMLDKCHHSYMATCHSRISQYGIKIVELVKQSE